MSDQTITKTCSKCKQSKSLSEFYKNCTLPDGYQYECKTCDDNRTKEYRQTSKGKEVNRKARQRYRQTEKGKVTQNRYRIQHPKYRKAGSAIQIVIRNGNLSHPDSFLCSFCPKPAQEYHHHKGYEPEHWLDVIPVCIPCHRKLPKFL